jgi:hypothetical protein
MYILRFSIHALLMGYIEPAEFSRVGLLAITLVSISSPDEELRKLGYESLGTFKKSLEVALCYFLNLIFYQLTYLLIVTISSVITLLDLQLSVIMLCLVSYQLTLA